MFTEHGFQVDVLWMDLDYTQDNQYFMFNDKRFPLDKIEKFNAEIEKDQRFAVVIIDPHMKANPNFPVYQEGMDVEET